MRTLAIIIFSSFIFFSCGTGTSQQDQVTARTEKAPADTTKQDSSKVEKRSLFPEDDKGTETMDEIVKGAKERKL